MLNHFKILKKLQYVVNLSTLSIKIKNIIITIMYLFKCYKQLNTTTFNKEYLHNTHYKLLHGNRTRCNKIISDLS